VERRNRFGKALWPVAALLIALFMAGCLPSQQPDGEQPGRWAYESAIPAPEKREKVVRVATEGKQEGVSDGTVSPRETAAQARSLGQKEAEEAVRKFGVNKKPPCSFVAWGFFQGPPHPRRDGAAGLEGEPQRPAGWARSALQNP
jgi:hypothetical protein